MGTEKSPRFTLLAAGLAVAVILVLAAIFLRTQNAHSSADSEAIVTGEGETSQERKAASSLQVHAGSSSTNPAAAEKQETSAGAVQRAHQTVESSRQFYSDKWERFEKVPEGYQLEGVVHTEEGLTLAPADENSTGTGEVVSRRGSVESPPLLLDFPSNFMMPLWRHKAPQETGIGVEMAVSPDGEQWSQWFPLEESGDEISPTYPDGSPNPNYGFVGGTGITNGTRLYSFAKYRVTLTSADRNAAPVLQEFKIYYVDSAGPDGVLADKPQTRPQE